MKNVIEDKVKSKKSKIKKKDRTIKDQFRKYFI